jgi:hypothetical protein
MKLFSMMILGLSLVTCSFVSASITTEADTCEQLERCGCGKKNCPH